MATPQHVRPILLSDSAGSDCTSFAHPARRRAAATLAAVTLSVPLTFALAGSSQAAPTLTIAQAQAQLAALQTQEDAADEAFNAGTIAANQAAAQAQSAQAAVGTQSAKLAVMEKGIASFAAATYTTGGLNPIDSLLAGGDPSVMLSKAANMNEIARNQNAQLIAFTAQREVLAGAQKTAADTAAAATAAVQQLAKAKNQIATVIAQEQGVLSHLQAQARAQLLAEQAQQAAASRAAARAALARVIASTPAPAPAPAPAATTSAAPSAPSGPSQPAPNSSGAAQVALQAAFSQMGKPYSYGAAGPDAYDCSGLTLWSYAHAGVSLPHSAADQYGYGTHVSRDQLQPGDLVFFDDGGSIGHVGIYVGNGQMIDANHSGGSVGVRDLYDGYAGATRL